MKVLLTGDRGYIGCVMAPYLSARGHQVTGWDTDFYFGCDFGPKPDGYVRLCGDVRDIPPSQLASFDAVIHLAALSNDPVGNLRAELTHEINFRASVRLAAFAKQAGVRRFLFASSCSLYGAGGTGLLDESAVLRPLTPYAVSKVRTEEALSKLADRDFCPVFLRNATAYGLSPRLRVDLVLNNLVGWAVAAGAIRILSDGTPWRPIVHVEDIAQAFCLVLEAPADLVRNQAFNVGSQGENYQIRHIASLVQEVAPHCRVKYAGQASPDPRDYRVDFLKLARTFPAFRPRRKALEGARELYAAYRAANFAIEDLQGRRYVRLNQLTYLVGRGELDSELRWTRRDAAQCQGR